MEPELYMAAASFEVLLATYVKHQGKQGGIVALTQNTVHSSFCIVCLQVMTSILHSASVLRVTLGYH